MEKIAKWHKLSAVERTKDTIMQEGGEFNNKKKSGEKRKNKSVPAATDA